MELKDQFYSAQTRNHCLRGSFSLQSLRERRSLAPITSGLHSRAVLETQILLDKMLSRRPKIRQKSLRWKQRRISFPKIYNEISPSSKVNENSSNSRRGISFKSEKSKILRSYKNLLAPKTEDYYAMNHRTPHPPNQSGKEHRRTIKYSKPQLALLLKPEYIKQIQKKFVEDRSRNEAMQAPSSTDFLTKIEEKYYNRPSLPDKSPRLSFPHIKTIQEPVIFSLGKRRISKPFRKKRSSLQLKKAASPLASPSEGKLMIRNFFQAEAHKKEEELRPSSREEREKRKYLYYPRNDLSEEQKEIISVSINQVKEKYDISSLVGVLQRRGVHLPEQ